MIRPEPDSLPLLERRQRLARRLAPTVLSPRVRLRVEGAATVPEGPLLVVANHACLLDPMIAGIGVPRAVRWVGTRTLLDGPLARVVGGLGMIPKTRFEADVGAVKAMLSWLDLGGAVGVFPEGERTWDGGLQALMPGLERIVARRRLPVLPVRLHNTYRLWPRWSPRLRAGTLTIEVGEAWTPPEGTTPAEVTAWMREAIAVDVRSRPDLPARSRRRARGLANVCFRCPICDAEERLVEARHALRCEACGGRVEIDDQHVLHVPGDAIPLEAWMATTQARTLEELPCDGEVLGVDGVEVVDHTEAPRIVGRGRLSLTREALLAGDWSLPLDRVRNTNIEYQRILEIRTTGDRYLKAVIPTGSAWRWPWTIAAAQRG